ncbi:MAG TPA: BrnA antitoxin family protein [Pseudolabrys sp.]|nr:BrnA antitoxin family protein [Pseudolabrys sp.]
MAQSAGSSPRGGRAGASEEGITLVSRDAPRRKGKTDWAALDALTDAEIEAQIANDPDWSDDWNWGEAVLIIPPKKKAISIRVDEDVLDFFKNEGAGYQRRMNAVLRSYMQQKKDKAKKRA